MARAMAGTMLNPDLEREYGWAIEAFRSKFGYAAVEVIHERRGRSLKVKVGDKTHVLYDAPTTGEVFALNATRDRLERLGAMLDG